MRPGDVLLGKFRVERVLGRGGMGMVVAVRNVELDELFAMKLMLPETLSNPEAVERFVREARSAARLKGEHVARVYDVGRLESGAPYMLMEHLLGDDLSGLLDKRGALSIHEATQYVVQACEAIAEAHGQGIVHRDLKPANLFLTSRANGSPCIKVLDFGISKKIDPTKKFGRTLTITGSFLGSPAFMSPEQMLNVKTVDMRSDIWALGAILYELTTGALPFHGETMTELVARVMHEPALRPSVLRPEIPPAFDHVVLTCLEKKPAKRYQSVEELVVALAPFAEKRPVEVIQGRSYTNLPRVDQDPDSEPVTRVVNPIQKVIQGTRPSRLEDDAPESEQATRKLIPAFRPSSKGHKLPNAADTGSEAANEYTVEMATRVRPSPMAPPLMTPKSTVPKTDSAPTAHEIAALRGDSKRIIFLGVAGIVVAIVVAVIMMQASEGTAQETSVDTPPPPVPTAPENVVKPITEPQPAVSALAVTPPPTATGGSGTGVKAITKPTTTSPTATSTTRKSPKSLYLQ